MTETVRTWRLLRELRRGTSRSPEATARLQGELLRAAVRHAWERVPLYRRLWAAAGVDPADVLGLDDLGRLPPLAADVARSALASGELVARGVDLTGVPAFPTSGSNGDRIWIPRGPAEQRRWRAAGLRIWLEHGYRWRYVTAQLEPDAGPAHPLQRLGVSRTAWISTRLPVEEQVDRLVRAGAEFVVGTPTALRRVARAAADGGAELPRARIVLCHGEVVDASSSALIARVLGPEPVAMYGLTELGYVAWQCERRDGYHVNADTCLVEVVRDGRRARPGELGELVITDLRGRTAPLVRYETGDLAVPADGPCGCGRTLPLLASVEGRARDALVLPGGRRVTTRAVVEHMSAVLAPDRYALVQEERTRFRLHVEPGAEGGTVGHLRRLLGEVDVEPAAGLPGGGAADKSRPLRSALRARPRGGPARQDERRAARAP